MFSSPLLPPLPHTLKSMPCVPPGPGSSHCSGHAIPFPRKPFPSKAVLYFLVQAVMRHDPGHWPEGNKWWGQGRQILRKTRITLGGTCLRGVPACSPGGGPSLPGVSEEGDYICCPKSSGAQKLKVLSLTHTCIPIPGFRGPLLS